MTTINLGRVRPVYKGEWSATATYEAYDFVLYQGSAYLALQNVPANYVPTTQTTHWVLFGAKGSKGDTGGTGPAGSPGVQGSSGATFTPTVSSAGVISWTNDKGLTNPTSVNIKGPKGDKGDDGSQGLQGVPGPAGTTDYTQLTNKPTSDTTLSVSGKFADAKAVGDALAKKVGYVAQTGISAAEKKVARTNIGAADASDVVKLSEQTISATGREQVYENLGLIQTLKELCLAAGATQAEIDALE